MDQQTTNRRIHELLGKCLNACGECTPNDYYNSIEHAREALAFAVEQKGESVVGSELITHLPIFSGWSADFAKVALFGPEVLCQTFLAVMDKEK